MTLTNAVLATTCLGLAVLAVALALALRRERRRPVAPTPPDSPAVPEGTTLLATLSHELRTPLNGIIGLAGVLLEHPLGVTERQYVRIIMESGNHLLWMINDVLDYARLNAGRLELSETSFDLRAVIRGAVELLELEAKSKKIDLVIDIAEDVPRRAGGDPARLRQILTNLVGNAVKFTRAGGVRVEVTRGATEPGGTRFHFAVSDTGIGIAPEAIARLFSEFGQGDASISRRYGGSGLGLVICRQLIERMGGRIGVESIVGRGSVFRFDVLLRVRRASDDAREPPAEPAAEGRIAASLHVLVAEDNATNRLVATRLLERIGHSVDSVQDGRQAVAAVQGGQYDVVLMDMMMPMMDGLAATAAIRALPGTVAGIPIVGLTAADSHSDEMACRAAGMNHFVTKPIVVARLVEAIQAVMAGRPAEAPPARTNVVENRTFDPAALDELVRELGANAAAEIARDFVDTAPGALAALRERVSQGADAEATRLAQSLANTARRVGLLRVRRAAAEIANGPVTSERMGGLEALLWAGIEELRMWRP